MQPVDFTTLIAVCTELQANWLPARLEQVYQRDRHTLCLGLRTLDRRGWLTISWHPQAARIGIGDAPPRSPDTFTFSQQLRHQLGGLALSAIEAIAPWERAIDLQFSRRPGEPPLWHLYTEIMGRYSNVILTNQEQQIVTVAYQVSSQQSSLRSLQTGQPYEVPPAPTEPTPSLEEPFERWHQRISLVPGPLRKNLLKAYRGLSSALLLSMIDVAGLDPNQPTDRLSDSDYQALFQQWQEWLHTLNTGTFKPGWTAQGYTVMGWSMTHSTNSVQELLNHYYTIQTGKQEFAQLHQQLTQKLNQLLEKLRLKATGFRDRLHQSDGADQYREQADLLMAHLHHWQPGLRAIELPDFTTGNPVKIPLDPEKNAVQNAQALYKRHQKLKRARHAVEPLLADVQAEIHYLEQVEAAIAELSTYQNTDDLDTLKEIRDELIQQEYLKPVEYRTRPATSQEEFTSQPYHYYTPNGLEVLVGRNNRQNDQLTFRTANDYDLWFHTQEIPGSHVLLRLKPGIPPEDTDVQFAANLAAFHSRARLSEQVPVVYTEPRHVFKPKGAKPGMTVYKHERVIWAQPQHISAQALTTKKL